MPEKSDERGPGAGPGEGQGPQFWLGRDVRPVPDPTELTTAALAREIASLKEIIFTRLDAMDRAIVVFNDNLTRVPTATDRAVGQLQQLHDERFTGVQHQLDAAEKLRNEKFASIQLQFEDRDTRTAQNARQNEISIGAALQAAKESVAEQNRSSALAIGKLELSTDKRFDQLMTLISTNNAGTDGRILDIKDRLTRIEGQALGKMETKAETHSNTSIIVAIIGVAIAIFVAIMTFLARGPVR